jgi:hypothetical protein
VGVGGRLRAAAEWVTWWRFIYLFLGINTVLASSLGVLALDPPDWLRLVIGVMWLVVCIPTGLAVFAWFVYRLVAYR